MATGKKPKHHRLFEKSTAKPTRIRKAIGAYEEILDRLKGFRSRFAHRRFVELDQYVGRSDGFFADIFEFREVLPLDRMLLAADYLGVDPQTLVASNGLTSAPIGNLPARTAHLAGQSRPLPYLDHLVYWATALKIDSAGQRYSFPVRI